MKTMKNFGWAIMTVMITVFSSETKAQWNDTASPSIFYNVTGGKVGIGTSTPKTILDLGNSGGAMFVLNPGTAPGVNYTGYLHNDMILGNWLTDGISNAFISTGYIQDARRKFHIGSASSNTFASASFVPHFTVTSGGFVGVGASNPRAKLDLGRSGGAMLVLNPGTTSTVDFTRFEHNDMIMGNWFNKRACQCLYLHRLS